jgi:hypothetical protein
MKKNILLFAGMAAISYHSIAQEVPEGRAPGRAAGGATRTVATSISTVTKNMKKFEGYFNFYYDDKTGQIYLEVDKFDKEFLYFKSLTDGAGRSAERGQASDVIAKFIKVGPKVMLVEPNYEYRAVTTNVDEIHAVENAFAKSVLWGFTPLAIEGDKVLIDITPFIVRDSQGIGSRLGTPEAGRGGARGAATGRGGAAAAGAGFRIDETRSGVYIENTKNFPKNSEFEALITLIGGAAGGGRFGGGGNGVSADPNAVTVRMHQSFIELPDGNYKPRKFDPRSSFNLFSYIDFSAPLNEPQEKKFSRRHRLAKKTPNAAVSEAVEPIIYYVDRGAPELIKKALIEGGSWWNQAFEAAGYKNAFQVKELPEGADPMDIRYNVVNWVNRAGTTRAFSYGSSYIDPRTGEIIKGVVTLGSDRHRQDMLIMEGLLQPYADGKPVDKRIEQIAYARLRQLSAHEIGHTLGFTHNFAASIKDRASVMDYPFPRITLKADGSVDISDAYAKGIGSWDKRAVMWGYGDFGKKDENAELDKIMKETLRLGFKYIPDIGGYTHPESHQWDDGVNAVDELTKLMKIRRKVLDNFSEKAIRQDAPLATLEEVLVPIYLLHRYQIEAVAKSVGGLYFTHAVKGDGQEPTKMVAPEEQWRAFDGLMGTISPDALALPDGLISKIPPRPTGYASTVETFSGYTGPTFDPVAAAESAAGETLSSLLNAERAARLIEFHGRDNNQPGFIAMASKLIDQTWKSPVLPGYKGELQTLVNNMTLKYLLQLAANTRTSEIVRGQAHLEIEELKTWMEAKVAGAPAEQKASLLYALAEISEFKASPSKFEVEPSLEMPPGAPIGMPDMAFLNDY